MKLSAELLAGIERREPRAIARAISLAEEFGDELEIAAPAAAEIFGITGAPGSGKSTLTDQLVAHFRAKGARVGVIAIDPSSPRTGGALLGDRIRMMRHSGDADVVIRSMASRGRIGGLCRAAPAGARIMALAGCSPVFLETVGAGQADCDIVAVATRTLLVVAPGQGDDIQAMKAGMIELADVIVVNKCDRPDADALLRDMQEAAHDRGQTVVAVSAANGTGIAELGALLEELR